MKKYSLSFLTLTMALSSGMVFAAGVGTVVSAKADIRFSGPIAISHTVTPAEGLTAGSVNHLKTLVTGEVILTGETSHPTIAVTFADGLKEGTDGSKRTITIDGGSDKLKVRLGKASTDAMMSVGSIDNGITLNNNDVDKTGRFNYVVSIDGTQTVAAGNYTINLSAQRWSL